MTKYKEYFDRMLTVEKEFFDEFRALHDRYALEPEKWQNVYNEEGEKALLLIRKWESLLCSQSEKGGYGVFTGGLAEKFMAEIRREFPMIDNIGLKSNAVKATPAHKETPFVLKKINLNK